MGTLADKLTVVFSDAFASAGYDPGYGEVRVSDRPDLCQFQCNGALAAARQYRGNPRQIAQNVVDSISAADVFDDLSLAGPGFINIVLKDEFVAAHIQEVYEDERLGCKTVTAPGRILVDYGGPNVAKPLHVGHLRAAIIGESIVRICRFVGHEVIGDVHLGDWGLQMGLIIEGLRDRRPDLPYFDAGCSGPYPEASPVTIGDLEELYPQASEREKIDSEFAEAARQVTVDLQAGRPGYQALWQHFRDVSVDDLRQSYELLNIRFDLWLGESDTQDRVHGLIARLKAEGYARESRGALVVEVDDPEDKESIPPLMLEKTDGAVLYGTTDLATIDQRVEQFRPDYILYVVDNRQQQHFRQVFKASYKTGVAPESTRLEHNGFGTMNGKDGKPFKTREGGVMKLKDLIELVTDHARARIETIDSVRDYDDDEKGHIARIVGVAALKYADLMNHRTKDYVFDLDRFSSFEGRTGPYILYAAVRIKSVLRRAGERGLQPGRIMAPQSESERDLDLKLSELPSVVGLAFETRAPNHLCEYAFQLATAYNRFYHTHHILNEEDVGRRASWLAVSGVTLRVLERVLDLLGIEVPKRM
ncbi:MAG: arginine--tRNA ligase [Gemmatimonadetes bacterium]|nr:arginine--tRNA ligase [Gemmatimonadota bacterium]